MEDRVIYFVRDFILVNIFKVYICFYNINKNILFTVSCKYYKKIFINYIVYSVFGILFANII